MKLFRWLLMSFLFLAFLCSGSPARADDTIRVLLKQDMSMAEFAVVQGAYQLVDGGTGLVLAELLPGEHWSIIKEGLNLRAKQERDGANFSLLGNAIFRSNEGSDQAIFRFGNIRYRGDLYIHSTNDRLMAVNAVGLEEYLYGVLPKEMGPSLPEEALKAQAVACRTIAMYRRGSSSHYDVTSGTQDQVYGGYEGELVPGQERIWRAVDATRGEMIYYDGKLIEAVFHSNAGGYTATSQSVWGGERPYLQSVPSPYDAYALEYPYQNSTGWPASSYQWTKNFSSHELSNRLNYWNQAYPNDQILVGDVIELRPYWEQVPSSNGDTIMGRVYRLDIVGTQGIKSLTRERIRQVFDLRSNFFTLEGGSSVAILNGTNEISQLDKSSSLAVVSAGGRITLSDNKPLIIKSQGGSRPLQLGAEGFTFVGKGFGHGVGMSQWGAIGMAEAGYNYQEIIEHYYNQNKFDGRLQIRR